jgi:large subunit ribosomal protein L18
MRSSKIKMVRRLRRKRGIAKHVRGTAAKPRLTVSRSHKHIYAQLIDDHAGQTICAASTRHKAVRGQVTNGGNIDAAKVVGTALAEMARSKQVETICFDRNGYRYHGRIRALADAVREGGLKF